MQAYPLATLFSGSAGDALMSLIPLIVETSDTGEITLFGHLDRNNEHSDAIIPGAAISFQFLGPDSYASPDLYPDAHLPGWLYVAVQGHGTVDSLMNNDELRQLLVRSSLTFGRSEQQFALAPADHRIDLYIHLIKGFRIRVGKVRGIAKLAQDKGRADSEIAKDFLASRDNSSSLSLFNRILQETI